MRDNDKLDSGRKVPVSGDRASRGGKYKREQKEKEREKERGDIVHEVKATSEHEKGNGTVEERSESKKRKD